jgi:pimeloyl-ACP methyl ester carboxylesterase
MSGLSPRRRALVLAVAGIVAAALIAVGARFLLADSGPVPAQDRPGPVLLVPGYGGGTTSLAALATRIEATGRATVLVPLPGNATGNLTEQAAEVERQVQAALRDGAPSVDVVGYSAGGVVARVWVQEHDGARKARRVVTLGSPHHGTRLAAAGAALGPGSCPVACQQLAPGSSLLDGLDTPVPEPPHWLALWTAQDQTVTPPDSARLEGAVNVEIQSVCPGRQVSHSALPTDPFVTAAVLRAIGPGPLTAPEASDCVSS